MKRIRWYGTEWPFSVRSLATRLKGYAFGPDSSDGFAIDRVRETYIQGRFVERISYTEAVSDPFGNETAVDRVEYRTMAFTLNATFPQIELMEGQRVGRMMITRLTEACDFAITLEQPHVDCIKWQEVLQRTCDVRSEISAVQVSTVEFAPGVVAKMVLRGREGVVRGLQSAVGTRRYQLDKVELRCDHLHGRPFSAVLVNNGAAAVSDQHYLEMIPLLRTSLAQLHAQRVMGS